MEGGVVGHNFEMGLPKDYPSQIWFNLVQQFQVKTLKIEISSIVHCSFSLCQNELKFLLQLHNKE
jgi:hypothetical protein